MAVREFLLSRTFAEGRREEFARFHNDLATCGHSLCRDYRHSHRIQGNTTTKRESEVRQPISGDLALKKLPKASSTLFSHRPTGEGDINKHRRLQFSENLARGSCRAPVYSLLTVKSTCRAESVGRFSTSLLP